jgi:hypothetical protein
MLAIAAAALLSAYPLPPARQAEAAEETAHNTAVAPIPKGGGLTLGSRAGSVLVGLTLTPGTPGPNDLSVYVLGPDGPEATASLPVQATVGGAAIALAQCAYTCRSGTVTLEGGERVAVDVGTPEGGRALFRLPSLPAAPGERLLEHMLATMNAVTSYRLQEDLTSGLGTSVHTTYAFEAPNSFESRTVENGSRFQTVWIGDTRYTRDGDAGWKIEQGAPAVPVPTYVWDSFRPYEDARIVGTATADGTETTELAVAGGDQDLPIWFRLWVDPDGLVHRAEMRAPGHFMDQRYYDFDASITIQAPEGVGR